MVGGRPHRTEPMKHPALLLAVALVGAAAVSGCSDPVDTSVPLAQREYTVAQLQEIGRAVNTSLHLDSQVKYGGDSINAPNDLVPAGETIAPKACANYVSREKSQLASMSGQNTYN